MKLVLASAMAAWPSLQVVLQAVALEGLLVVPLEVPLTWVVPCAAGRAPLLVPLVVPLEVPLTWVVRLVVPLLVPPGGAPGGAPDMGAAPFWWSPWWWCWSCPVLVCP